MNKKSKKRSQPLNKITKNSKLYNIVKSEKIKVNSAHHQSVKFLVKILNHLL